MWPLILILFALILLVFSMLLNRLFHVKAVKHSSTPAELGIEFEEIHFPTKNGISLYGWWIQHPDGPECPALILLHGWKRNLERMMPYIENLHQHYNLLAFDARSHGSSGKDNYVSMPRFAEDIIAAIDFLKRGNINIIGVIGLSIGGAAAIYAASMDQRIKTIVTVGAFADPGEVMKLEFQKKKIPYYPLGWLILEYVQFRIGNRFRNIAPDNNMAKTQAKILLIHGKEDTTAPYQHAERLLKASVKNKVELWGLEDKGHSDCHKEPGFWRRIQRFLEGSLK
ncbi:MAG: alpha/beta fold hydrolase [Bacteroidales bacterium]|nr:alpha/beta fold hydrolase [Bacteroidales bacterium]